MHPSEMRRFTLVFISFLVLAASSGLPLQADDTFRRGDVNGDNQVNISDASALLVWLFMGAADPTCMDAVDVNDSGTAEITDAILTLNWLFTGGLTPPAPGPFFCGEDPTDDELDCVDNGDCPPDNNDECEDAASLTLSADALSVSVEGSTSEANRDAVTATCGPSNAPGIWFSVVGLGANMSASTCNNANYDTRISVFTGPCGDLRCVGQNDDAPGCGLTSQVNWEAGEGVTYSILVHGFGNNSGDFTLAVESARPAPPQRGEIVRGYLAARLGGRVRQDPQRDVYLPGVEVYLRNLDNGTDGLPVQTDLSGRFTLIAPEEARYQVRWNASGIGLVEDGSRTFAAGVEPVFLSTVPILMLPRDGSTIMYGSVSMADGSVPRTYVPFANVNAFATVDLLDEDGGVIHTVFVNNFGEYLLPRFPVQTDVPFGSIRATMENEVFEQIFPPNAGLDLASLHRFDIRFTNERPSIEPLIARDSLGRWLKSATPGSTIKLTARSEDADADPLGYRWVVGAGNGVVDVADQREVSWTLPNSAGLYGISVVVYDGSGGYAEAKLKIEATEGGRVRFSGIVDATDAPAVAGAVVEINGEEVTTRPDGFFQILVRDTDRYVFNVRAPLTDIDGDGVADTGYALLSRIYGKGVTGGRWTLRRATVQRFDAAREIVLTDRGRGRNCLGLGSAQLDWDRFPQLKVPQFQDGAGNVVPPFELEEPLPLPFDGPLANQRELLGDANCDGSVNVADIQTITAHILNGTELCCRAAADANGDGAVNAADAQAVQNIVVAGQPSRLVDCGPVAGQNVRTVFEDDFNRENGILEGWVHPGGAARSDRWQIERNRLVGTGSNQSETFAFAPVELPESFELNFNMSFIRGGSPNDGVGRHGGIMFCAQNRTSNRDRQSTYTLDWIDRRGVGDARHGLRLRLNDGTIIRGGQLLTDPPRNLRVVVNSDSIEVYGDGPEALIRSDDTALRGGNLGFWMYTTTQVMAFDNIRVTTLGGGGGGEGCGPGMSIVIPAGALVDRNGESPQGPVTVAVSTIDLMTPDQMPGDYTVARRDGGMGVMQSYGAGSIEITDGATQYNLREGATAEVVLPVDPSQLAAGGPLPEEIPIYFYDEERGVWEEDGFAELTGNEYRARVSHFSNINADVEFTNPACVKIISGPNMPATYELEVIIPTGNNSAPIVLTHTMSGNSTDVIYNLPTNTNIVLIPVAEDCSGSSDIPFGVFVVNTGDEQDPPAGLPAGPNFDQCKAEVNITNLLDPLNQVFPSAFLAGLNLAFSAENISEISPSNPSGSLLIANLADATEAYYNQVDPLGDDTSPEYTGQNGLNRRTLSGFMEVNGFNNPNGGSPSPDVDPTNDIDVVFANSGDLGFGREMHCIVSDPGNGYTACYVHNFGNIGTCDIQDVISTGIHHNQTQNGLTPDPYVATVAMEYSPIEGALNLGPVVKFFVYDGSGNLVDPQQGGVDLDNRGERPIPQLCMTCHGGAYSGNPAADGAAVFDSPQEVDLGSKYLPFDLSLYTFEQSGDYSKANQQTNFQLLNETIVAISPPPASASDAIAEVIQLMYANGTPQEEGFVVSSWQGPPIQEEMYREVIAPSCRTCHIASPFSTLIFDDHSNFDDVGEVSLAKYRVCDEKSMPHAQVTNGLFWTSSFPNRQPTIFMEYGETFFPTASSGIVWDCELPPIQSGSGSSQSSFTDIQTDTLTPRCGCHTTANVGNGQLGLLGNNAYANLNPGVNYSTTVPQMLLVDADPQNGTGNLGTSFLWLKLTESTNDLAAAVAAAGFNCPSGCGDQMPAFSQPLDVTPTGQAELNAIQAWIQNGAQQ